MKYKRIIAGAVFAAVLYSAVGCSSFQRNYDAVAASPVPAGSIEGAWEGSWTSKGGHTGALKCILKQTNPAGSKEVSYEARFQAKFWKIFTAHYSQVLNGRQEGVTTILSGDHDLGWCGGIFHYEAHVDPSTFNATYSSKADNGTFDMKRPRASN